LFCIWWKFFARWWFFFGEKLENNEISNYFSEGGHSFKGKKIKLKKGDIF
jgi:hypothetical protein